MFTELHLSLEGEQLSYWSDVSNLHYRLSASRQGLLPPHMKNTSTRISAAAAELFVCMPLSQWRRHSNAGSSLRMMVLVGPLPMSPAGPA